MLKTGLRAANVAGSGLADVALGAAGNIDVARAHDTDVGGSLGLCLHASRSHDGNLGLLRLDRAGVDIARAGDLIFRRLRPARARLDAARSGDGKLQRLDVESGDVERPRTGDIASEAVALHMIDLDVARSRDRSAGQLRHRHGEGGLAVSR